jgi:hypothetical protein
MWYETWDDNICRNDHGQEREEGQQGIIIFILCHGPCRSSIFCKQITIAKASGEELLFGRLVGIKVAWAYDLYQVGVPCRDVNGYLSAKVKYVWMGIALCCRRRWVIRGAVRDVGCVFCVRRAMLGTLG